MTQCSIFVEIVEREKFLPLKLQSHEVVGLELPDHHSLELTRNQRQPEAGLERGSCCGMVEHLHPAAQCVLNSHPMSNPTAATPIPTSQASLLASVTQLYLNSF